MVDETDLDAAVLSGVLTSAQAERLRNFSAERRGAPAADEERFGLVGGLADIMTAVGLGLLLGAALVLLYSITPIAAMLLVPLTWLLARHLTAKRRLTLTSFVLFGVYVLAVGMSLLALAWMVQPPSAVSITHLPTNPLGTTALQGVFIASATTIACLTWWRRFHLPIAYAAAVVAGINVITHLMRIAVPEAATASVSLYLLITGVAMLALAIWWDLSDIRRETRRADVAFWLHAIAGYQIAGASFRLIFGVEGNPEGWERRFAFSSLPPDAIGAVFALLLFTGFCAVALALDRRSLVMSSLIFVLPALARMTGLEGTPANLIAAMALGTLLLSIATLWMPLRALILGRLPIALRAQLPRTSLVNHGPRPVP